MAEREVLRDAVGVSGVDGRGAAQIAAALRAFALAEVAAAGAAAHDLAGARDLEPLGHRFLCFNTFGASHKFLVFSSEKGAQYR